jgi:hypothetical protein
LTFCPDRLNLCATAPLPRRRSSRSLIGPACLQDHPPRRKDVPDDSPPEPVEARPVAKLTTIELRGPLGCAAALLLLAIAFAILVAAAFAGLIAVAVAFWVGLGFVVLAIIAALIRGRFP